MVKRIRAYRRSQRKQQVIKQLRVWHENDYAKEVTSYKLANALDMVASQYFINILNELVEEGDLEVREVHRPGRFPGKIYLLTEKHIITEKYHRRHISVKSRGQNVAQLEMGI
jgi:hypothetical protein